jgi:hypothetical protein
MEHHVPGESTIVTHSLLGMSEKNKPQNHSIRTS